MRHKFSHRFWTRKSSCKVIGVLPLRHEDLQVFMSDIGYRTKVYSDIRYNVGLCALQSDIGRSNIRLSPVLLITDVGLSAHLCLFRFKAKRVLLPFRLVSLWTKNKRRTLLRSIYLKNISYEKQWSIFLL